MTIRNLTRRATILAALGVTSLALVAASPASAIYRDYEAGSEDPPVTERTVNQQSQDPPVDENGKKSCQVVGEIRHVLGAPRHDDRPGSPERLQAQAAVRGRQLGSRLTHAAESRLPLPGR